MFFGGLNSDFYCLPVAKRENNRLALRKAATSGKKCFFLGTDSAPHLRKWKAFCGCAGIFNSPVAIESYLTVFEEEDALDNFEKFEILNTNFVLKKKEYLALRNYFHNSESKPIYIKKSKVFLIDDNDDTLIISPIEKINFTTSQQDNFKKLNIKGNLFDLNFKSFWKKKYNSQMNSQIEIDFKEPNISIKNQLNY